MDITLGPWTTEKGLNNEKQLTEVMADEAWNTVTKSAGFTPRKPSKTKATNPGFTILGKLTTVSRTRAGVEVAAQFNVWVDGFLSTAVALVGRAAASGSWGAEEALRAVTESRVKTLLQAIKAGRVVRQG